MSKDYATATGRTALADALAQLAEERQKLVQLEEAAQRAQEQSWQTPHRVTEAEAALSKARADETGRLAREFAAGSIAIVSPVTTALQELEAAQAEDAQITRIRTALDAEMAQINLRLRRREAAVSEALADVVLDSTAFKHLFAEQTEAWARLRGIRKTFWVIQRALAGNMPQQLADRWAVQVSLDPEASRDATGQPIATDDAPVQAWREALEKLLVDPDTPLPTGTILSPARDGGP